MAMYDRGSVTPIPGQQQLVMGQPVYPNLRIGGSELPGGLMFQVIHPQSGQTISVELGDLSRPLSAASNISSATATNYIMSASGPLRERLTRPSSDHMRRRSASVASTSGMEHESFARPGNPRHLADRLGGMDLNGNHRPYHDTSSIPDLTRSDPSHSFSNGGNTSFGRGQGSNGWGNGGNNNFQARGDHFSRPSSRMSNRGGGWGGQPYARPASAQSFRSNNSFNSFNNSNGGFNGGFRSRQRDGFYPKYEHGSKQNVGSYPILPPERRRPFFTPVPEDPVAAVLVKNIAADCSLADINSTFLDFGKMKCVELIERLGATMVAYIEYESKDDADMAIQATNGVIADKFMLETTHIDPNILHRPHKLSEDPAFRLTNQNGLTTEKARPPSAKKSSGIGMEEDGGRTPQPAMFESKSPTPLPSSSRTQASASAPGYGGSVASSRWANDAHANGSNGVATPVNGVSTSANDTVGTGWSEPTSSASTTTSGWDAPPSSTDATSVGDGWGLPANVEGWGATPDVKTESTQDATSWREQAVREESSDIDLH